MRRESAGNEIQNNMFKNFKFIGIVCLVLAAMVAFSSCSKPEKQIIGKWKITKASLKNDGYEEEDEFDDKGEMWVFKDNGRCVLHIFGQDFEGKYTVKNNTLTIDIEYDFGYGEEVFVDSSDLDIDEINKEEMSISGTIYAHGSDFGVRQKFKLSFEFEKK